MVFSLGVSSESSRYFEESGFVCLGRLWTDRLPEDSWAY
ncbi:hypothetical protein Gotur_024737 [Gossypium turneri]